MRASGSLPKALAHSPTSWPLTAQRQPAAIASGARAGFAVMA
jgi:hypothetical protein